MPRIPKARSLFSRPFSRLPKCLVYARNCFNNGNTTIRVYRNRCRGAFRRIRPRPGVLSEKCKKSREPSRKPAFPASSMLRLQTSISVWPASKIRGRRPRSRTFSAHLPKESQPMKLGLEGKVVLITGGSKGIGLSCAQAFAAEGARVAIASRSRENLDNARQVLIKEGFEVVTALADF